jgi:alpha-galactosidase
LRRSVVLTRSDVIYRNPISAQCIGYGLSNWIPYHGMGAVTVDPYVFRSGLGSACVFALNLNAGDAPWQQLKNDIEQFVAYRPFYEGDFYPLTPYTLDPNQVLAWQYDRPEQSAGLVQAFRRSDCPTDSIDLKLQGLDANRTYTITNIDDPAHSRTVLGADLTSDGLDVNLPAKNSAVLLLYRATDSAPHAARSNTDSPR